MKRLFSAALLFTNIVLANPIRVSEFLNENAPYPSCHASTIVETREGELVAAWFGGTKERAPDVGIWVTIKGREGWSKAVEVANGLQPDGSRLPTWNPVLFQGKEGPLHLYYKMGPKPSEWWGMELVSEDGGHSWGKAQRLPDGILGPIKNKPVVLADGTWCSPSSTEKGEDGWLVHFEMSQDQGKTWTKVGPVAKGLGFDAIQPSVLFHKDGLLEAVCRTKDGILAATLSKDQGKTWSALMPLGVPNPNSGTDAVTLADGRQLLVYNHSGVTLERPTKGVRYPINLALSKDGITWVPVLTLEDAPYESGYAYPAIIQTRDGLVHITYTWDRKMIRHMVVDPSELKF